MRLLKRFATLLSLAALLGLIGCSSLTLAYNQLPLLAGLWVGDYLDLDSPQRGKLKEQLQAWHAWHRREELPQWQALLRQAHASLEDGVTQEELLALERSTLASVDRCVKQAAPLAAPLMASLKPEQWQHLQKELDEKTEEWREKQNNKGGADERAKRYTTSLERWLGDLDRPVRRQAQADARGWRVDLPSLVQGRAMRQARTLEGLRAWSQQDLAGGTALLMRNLQPLPAELPYREQIIASVLKLLNGLDAAQREQVRQHWNELDAELRTLQSS